MLEIQLKIDEIDYDKAIDLLLPLLEKSDTKLGNILKKHEKVTKKVAHRYIAKKGNDGVETRLVSMAEKKQDMLQEKASDWIKDKDLPFVLREISIQKCDI